MCVTDHVFVSGFYLISPPMLMGINIIETVTPIQRYVPINELAALYNIKKYWGTICAKLQRNNYLTKMYKIYIQSTDKRKQQPSTDKDTTSELKHLQTLTLKKKANSILSLLSTNAQTTQLTLSKYTHRGKTTTKNNFIERRWGRDVFCSWNLKDDKDEQRQIFEAFLSNLPAWEFAGRVIWLCTGLQNKGSRWFFFSSQGLPIVWDVFNVCHS